MSYDDRVKSAMRDIVYEDGISALEAENIANAYLYLYGRYKGRATIARISESESDWLGKVFVIKLAATPVDANLPYVQIDKDSGEVSWKHGPTLAKINLDELDNMEPSVTEQ